jgi:hypothetical protein
MSVTTEEIVLHGWTEMTTSDGYSVAGSQDTGWYVVSPVGIVVARYPAALTVWEALDRWRAHLLEAERVKAME